MSVRRLSRHGRYSVWFALQRYVFKDNFYTKLVSFCFSVSQTNPARNGLAPAGANRFRPSCGRSIRSGRGAAARQARPAMIAHAQRCEPVPAVVWSIDPKRQRRRSSSGMAGDYPPTPSWREPVPAVAWSIDPKRPCTTTKKGNPAGFPQRQRRGRPTAQMPFLRPWRFGRASSVRRFASSICSNVPISSARRSSQCPCSATGLPTCAVPCGT